MQRHFYRIIAIFSLFMAMEHLDAQVLINEFMSSNAAGITDPDFGRNADWLEIYNTTNAAVNLTGWHLSDSESDSLKWAFPASTIIPAHGFLLIWADGESTGLHTNFKIGSSGELLKLYDANDKRQDQITFPEQLTDVSYGRNMDGGLPWGFFEQPTPGNSNNASVFYEDFVLQVPVFSHRGGFFNQPVTVAIQDLYNAGTIRYTITGAVPTESSPIFTQPLQINSTTVVKARMFYPNRIPGPVETNTYFLNEDLEARGLAVLSLSSDPEYFFSPDSGLYVQDYKPTWEYPVHLEFYEPDGLLGFHHDAGVQVGGENSWILPQKLLNIYSRKQYGSGHFDYQLFPNNPRKTWGDIILRTSGNDWSNTLFRDGMMQGLIDQEADLDVQEFRPCAVFINGAYFGIHNIREKQDADFIEYYHGIVPDSLDYIENEGEIKEGDDVAYQQMVTMLTSGVQSDAAFQALDAIADTKDFVDYIISQIFVANTSWGHNIALFRQRSPDARWRWLPHDYDRGFNVDEVGGTAMEWATATNGAEYSNAPWATLFLRKMLENNTFRQQFITRFADHLYVTFNSETIKLCVDKHAAWIRAEIPYHVDRWSGTTSSYGDGIPTVAFWENEVALLNQFGVQRNSFIFDNLNNFFGLSGTSTLNLDVSAASHGFIRLHEIKVPSYPWTGKYFQNRTFTLTAVALPGFNFIHWEKRTGTQNILLAAGSNWEYRDATTAPPSDWNQFAFDDASWSDGPAQLGYGDGDESTILSFGNNAGDKTPSYYFRTTFNVDDPAALASLIARLKVDDGAVVYLNGNEIWRQNIPAAPATIAFSTLALTSVSGTGENAWTEWPLPASILMTGLNVIAVEVHQADRTSSDISFDFELQSISYGATEIIGTAPILDVTLDSNVRSMRAVFESDGTCGILPDTIFQDMTLTAACSPYTAGGDVVVRPKVTLTAEPGVEIRFPEKANLFVQGDLQLQGTANNIVVLKNAEENTVWGGIFLENTTAVSAFSYVTLENASAGTNRLYFPAAISAYHSDMLLDHMDLTHVRDNPVFARFSNVELTHSILKSAVTGDCINVKQGYARVENCDFEGGNQPDMDAIDYDGVIGGIIRNNVIHDFRGDNCDGLDIGEQCRDLLIEKNFIYHCFDKGISVGQQSTVDVRGNIIAYTAIGIALKDQSHADIEHCTLFGNQKGISAYEKNPGNLGGTGIITDCIVSNASQGSYVTDGFSGLTLLNCLSDLDSISSPGTLNIDPQFVNPTWYDFQLNTGSPAIGAGTNGTNLGAVTFTSFDDQPRLMISEILYNDTLTTKGEFLEIYNPGTTLVDLTNYKLSAAVDFIFPADANILAGSTVIVAKSSANFTGAGFPVYEWISGKLRNEGEVIYLFDADGLLVDFVRYNNHAPWPESNSLLGRSLELTSGLLDNHFATSWSARQNPGGTPGEVTMISGTSFPTSNAVEMTVFPNPASDVLNVAIKGDYDGTCLIRVIDAIGRVVYSKIMNGSGGIQIITIPSEVLHAGNYFVSLIDVHGRTVQTEGVVVH